MRYGSSLYDRLDSLHARSADEMTYHLKAAKNAIETVGMAFIAVITALVAIVGIVIGTILLEWSRILRNVGEWIRSSLVWLSHYVAFGLPFIVYAISFPTLVSLYANDPIALVIISTLILLPGILALAVKRGDPGAALFAGIVGGLIALFVIYIPLIYRQLLIVGVLACNTSYTLHTASLATSIPSQVRSLQSQHSPPTQPHHLSSRYPDRIPHPDQEYEYER